MFSLINNYIQRRLQRENLEEVSVIEASKWLSEEKILSDSYSSPGFPLRRNIQRGNIFGAYKKSNYYWYIRRESNYENIISIGEFKQFFLLKSRTSIYRKIDFENIPKKKLKSGRIYFSVTELMKWSMKDYINILHGKMLLLD